MARSRIRIGCAASVVFIIVATLVIPSVAQGPCMSRVYSKGSPRGPEYAFDIAFDKDRAGRSFSCGPEIRASEARKALELFRFGVLYRDQSHMDRVLDYPVTVRIRKTLEAGEHPEVVTIRNFNEWARLQEGHLDKNQIAVVACAYLGNANVEAGQTPGFMIGDGMVWFQRFVGSPRVKVTSINLFPMDTQMVIRSCVP